MSDETTPSALAGEDTRDESLRPATLDEFVGQDQVREQLRLLIDGAKGRGQVPDHVLLSGPPGLGKTSLASLIANELGVTFTGTSGPAIERPADLASILVHHDDGGVLFIDEIHRLARPVEEVLYSAMEDYAVDVVTGQGPSARTLRLNVAPFTLVGATTRQGLLSSPLRDRFGVAAHMNYYDVDALTRIVSRSARILDVDVEADAAAEIARRSRGTPRIANRLLRRVRDYAQVHADGTVRRDHAEAALAVYGVDAIGLDSLDQRVLAALVGKFGGGPVGLNTLATAVGEEADSIEDAVEPFLIQLGFVRRTPRGRVAEPAAWAHLGVDAPREVRAQQALDLD